VIASNFAGAVILQIKKVVWVKTVSLSVVSRHMLFELDFLFNLTTIAKQNFHRKRVFR